MEIQPATEVTRLLEQIQEGDEDAAGQLLPVVYEELRRIAGHYMRSEREDHTLQPTALVHEAYVRLAGQRSVDWAGRTHFVAVAATSMRRILLDHARRHKAEKRGGGRKTTLIDDLAMTTERQVDLISLDQALTRLEALDARQARLVELRFFGGLSIPEAADVLDVSPTTAKRDWRFARAWLRRELGDAPSEA